MGRWKIIVFSVVSLVLSLFLGEVGFGQEKYPSKPIQVIVPVVPGGVTDSAARMLGEKLQESLKVPIVVMNKAGGGGAIAATYVLEQKPDGYTVFHAASGMIDKYFLIPNCPFTKDDFIPIARMTYGAMVLAVKKDAPWKSLEEFLESARKEPGKISVGVAGVGDTQDLVARLIETGAKVKFNIIPFKGDGSVIAPLLGGHAQAAVFGITAVTPYLQSGEMRGLAISSPERHYVFKDIPLFKEKNLHDVSLFGWTGIFVATKTPESVIKTLDEAYRQAATHPEIIEKLKKIGTIPGYQNQREFKEFFGAECDKIAKAADLLGLKKYK
jgi:tripartite-type tricarboxylate transporter receptor subunit TctC